MTVQTMQGFRKFVSMLQKKTVKYLLSAHRLNRRLQSWMRMKRNYSLDDLGLEESGLEKLIKASYHLLGLISYLTAGEQEVPGMDDHKGNKSTTGGRKDPYRFRTWIYSCRGGKL